VGYAKQVPRGGVVALAAARRPRFAHLACLNRRGGVKEVGGGETPSYFGAKYSQNKSAHFSIEPI